MMTKFHTVKSSLAAMFMFCAMALALTCGIKVEAATPATVKVDAYGTVTAEAPTLPAAIKVITSVTDATNSWTVTPGIYYFDEAGNAVNVPALGTKNYSYYNNGATVANSPIVLAPTASINVTYTKIVTSSPKEFKSNIKGFTGIYGGKYYGDGALWNRLVWKNSKMYQCKNGVLGINPTGRTPVGYTYYDATSNTLKTFAGKHYFAKGVHTTAVVGLEYYAKGVMAVNKTGWVKIGNKIYYVIKGKAVTGWKKSLPSYGKGVKKYTYYFSKTGVLDTNLIDNIGYNKFIQKDLKIITNKTTHNTTFYYKQDGEWVPAVTVICATAAKKGDTPSGTFRLEKTWNKRWFVYTKTHGAPYRYYQWAVHIKGTPTLFHSSTYRTKSASSLRADLYNRLGTSCTTHCIRLQAKYAKLIYDVATKTNKKRRVPVQIITSSNEGPFGHVSLVKIKSGTKWDPTDPNR